MEHLTIFVGAEPKLVEKSPPVPPLGYTGFSWIDAYRKQRPPADEELIELYRDVAYACANINARAVGSAKLRLYVRSRSGDAPPRARTKALSAIDRMTLKAMTQGEDIVEVMEHPLLDMLASPAMEEGTSLLSTFDLFEITQIYLEIIGRAYWLLERNRLGAPANVWLLFPQYVEEKRAVTSSRVIDYYEYRAGGQMVRYETDEIIPFRCVDLRDPYAGAFSPLEAAYSRVQLDRKYLSQAEAMLDNQARPDVIVTPPTADGVIGDAEAKRLEAALNSKFRGAGRGSLYISREAIDIKPLTYAPRDLAELAEQKVSLENIARCFDVPLSMLNRDANRASAEEGRRQHAHDAVIPRLERLAARINSVLVPMYDPSGRLFVAFDNPSTHDELVQSQTLQIQLASSMITPNEARSELGYPQIPGADSLLGATPQSQPSSQPAKPNEPPKAGEPTPTLKQLLDGMTVKELAVFQATYDSLRSTGRVPKAKRCCDVVTKGGRVRKPRETFPSGEGELRSPEADHREASSEA